MNYVVYDLEWNQAPCRELLVRNPFPLYGEIIQFGAVRLNDDLEEVGTFRRMVRPFFYKRMNSAVKRLTGITSEDLENADDFPTVVDEFRAFCGEDVCLLTWGADDTAMLMDNLKIHHMEIEWMPPTYNLQQIFNKQITGEKRQWSLAAAMEKLDIQQENQAHDALNDAVNTGAVARALDLKRGLIEYAEGILDSDAAALRTQHFSYPNRRAMNADTRSHTVLCPVCGKILSGGRWMREARNREVNLVSCPEHGDFIARVRVKQGQNNAVSVKLAISAADDDSRALYHVLLHPEDAGKDPVLLEQETGGAAAGAGKLFRLEPSAFRRADNASDLIERVLKTHDRVSIPRMKQPIVLDRPIVLRSGQRLTVHSETVMRMAEGCGGCMVRNENIRDARFAEADYSTPDTDIMVEGGIWEFGGSGISPKDPDPVMQSFGTDQSCLVDGEGNVTNVIGSQGAHGALLGVFFFSNCQRFTLRRITVRECGFYSFLLCGVQHFVVEDITVDGNHTDGVHINGPAAYGCVRRMTGVAGDDFVALNAWDWALSSVSFGEIHHILAEDLDCAGELRLLPGRKTYPDGTQVECPIHDCLFRRVKNIYCAKLYQQPNCTNDLTGADDRSDIPGLMKDIRFSHMELNTLTEKGFGEVGVDALFEIGADAEDITFEHIRVGLTAEDFRAAGKRLVEVGPKSSTWKRGYTDPAMWAELFDTDLICKADRICLRDVKFADVPCTERDLLIGSHALSLNTDYPNTTPKGGTGYGVLGEVTIE